jgi:hypothetical protein
MLHYVFVLLHNALYLLRIVIASNSYCFRLSRGVIAYDSYCSELAGQRYHLSNIPKHYRFQGSNSINLVITLPSSRAIFLKAKIFKRALLFLHHRSKTLCP